jgi:hypothetical protein
MIADEEVKKGIEIFRQKVAMARNLTVTTFRPLTDRFAFYVELSSGGKTADITIAAEFLADLPATKEYKITVDEYIVALSKRILNTSPNFFITRSGVPVKIELEWPFQWDTGRAASYILVSISLLNGRQPWTKCAVSITDAASLWLMKKDPFVRQRLVVNRARVAIDGNELSLYDAAERPNEYQRIVIASQGFGLSPASEVEIQEYISRKVFGLGFKQGNKDTRVWVLDPWDSEYLAVSSSTILQCAQVLEARKEIVLHEREFASAGEALLIRGTSLGTPGKNNAATQDTHEPRDRSPWDVFICHAWEDKEGFVEPLAQALQKHGLKVWYDKFVLKVGDSLRERIDEGLSASRYGIVVLSRAFFLKQWPKNELDGLVAKEVGGRKVILPIWHLVTRDDVHGFSPILSGRLAAQSKDGIETVVQQLLDAMG